jgi:hypothetical protein
VKIGQAASQLAETVAEQKTDRELPVIQLTLRSNA